MKSGKIILAFDPGLRTGWAAHTLGSHDYSGGILSPDEVVEHILKWNRTLRLDCVVVEDFYGAGRASQYGRLTILTIGRILGTCEALRIPHRAHGSQTKDPFLKDAERILNRRHKQHADDDVSALAHLLAEEALAHVAESGRV